MGDVFEWTFNVATSARTADVTADDLERFRDELFLLAPGASAGSRRGRVGARVSVYAPSPADGEQRAIHLATAALRLAHVDATVVSAAHDEEGPGGSSVERRRSVRRGPSVKAPRPAGRS